MKALKTIAATASLLAFSLPSLAAFDYDMATDFNVYTFGNFYARNGSTHGRVASGGTLAVQDYSFISPDGNPYADALSNEAVGYAVIGGGVGSVDLTTVHYGHAIFDGLTASTNTTYNGNLTSNSAGTLTDTTIKGTYMSPTEPGVKGNASWNNYVAGTETIPEDFAAAKAYFTDYSSALSSTAPTGNVNYTNYEDVNYTINLTGDGTSDTQVFMINATDLKYGYDIALNNMGDASSILINVAGTNVNFDSMTASSSNPNSIFSSSDVDVLFNFYEANSLTLANSGIYGSVLAPTAAVTGTDGHITGRLIADNFFSTDGFQFQLDATGTTPAVPEPSTYFMMAIGLGMLGLMVRKKLRKVY